MKKDGKFYSESHTGHLSEWGAAIAQICEEKGISKEDVLSVIESALSAAYKKETGRKGHIVRADFNEGLGNTKFYELYRVVGEEERDWSKDIPLKELDLSVIDKKREIKIWIEEEKIEQETRRDGAKPEEGEEEKKPFFRPEKDMLLKDAKKHYPKVKVGEILAFPVQSPDDFGRIAAQTAKQVILQKMKETEKKIIFEEYSSKVGDVLPGTIQRIEGVQVYVDLGKTIAILPRREQVIGERYDQGQRLKVYVLRVDCESRSAMVIVSRTHPGLVEGLFRLEVPEIFAGTVDVVKVVREPGQRAKVAVKSNENGIDPVGSCIGQRGTRVQAVTDELRGERIDIIEYNEDPFMFLQRALSPARVKRIETVLGQEKRARVLVEKDQQSIAIGKNGQNVRLASRLTEWEVDIEVWDQEAEDKRAEEEKMALEASLKEKKKKPVKGKTVKKEKVEKKKEVRKKEKKVVKEKKVKK